MVRMTREAVYETFNEVFRDVFDDESIEVNDSTASDDIEGWDSATVFFAFQFYTNFSGCMDIVLGISKTFGLKLPENFETPYFSKDS